MVHFPFSVVVAPAGQRYGHSPWRGRHACLLLVVASPFGIWQQSQSMHSECQPLLPRCDVSDEQQRHRMGCRRYRKADPAFSVTKLTCAMATWLFCQLQQPCASCGSALQHPLPVPLPRHPRQAAGDGASRAQAKKPRTGACDRVRAVRGTTEKMKLMMMVALPLQRHCFWRRSKWSLPSGWVGLRQCHAATFNQPFDTLMQISPRKS